MITQLFALLGYLVHLYVWAIILAAVFSMLAAFNVIDTRNRFVWAIGDFLTRLTEPALRPIRQVLPNFGAIDLSPWVAVLVLQFLVQPALVRIQFALSTGSWRALAF